MPNRLVARFYAAVLPGKRRGCRLDELPGPGTVMELSRRSKRLPLVGFCILYSLALSTIIIFGIVSFPSTWSVQKALVTPVCRKALHNTPGPSFVVSGTAESNWRRAIRARSFLSSTLRLWLLWPGGRICHEGSLSGFKTGSAEIPGLGRDWPRDEPPAPLRFAATESGNLRRCRSLGGHHVPA